MKNIPHTYRRGSTFSNWDAYLFLLLYQCQNIIQHPIRTNLTSTAHYHYGVMHFCLNKLIQVNCKLHKQITDYDATRIITFAATNYNDLWIICLSVCLSCNMKKFKTQKQLIFNVSSLFLWCVTATHVSLACKVKKATFINAQPTRRSKLHFKNQT